MSIEQIITGLQQNRAFMNQVVTWQKLPPRPGSYTDIPPTLDPNLSHALRSRGINQLYTHQSKAIHLAQSGQNVVIATRTASGKSLCYTLPVFDQLLREPRSTALYLFPTKALAQDQLANSYALASAGDLPINISTYDGDTARRHRTKIRKEAQIIISNPDMLHSGILPYHTQWRRFFANLRYVVVDEIHMYRGVFGSHVANVLRRLLRLCRFYGTDPQFILCSATIANPQGHAEQLTERPFSLVSESDNGAPEGAKEFILYNPPFIDEELGLRQSAILTAKDAAATFITQGVQTAVFARARSAVELLLSYLQDELAYREIDKDSITGYRGGYLPSERREIEKSLRDGRLRGVVATNALELGIDIGELDAAVLTGYPGSIASVWQQAGRAGRRNGRSVAIMVAGNSALDQYIAHHPQYILRNNPEYALINADNLRIAVKHMGCAAFELPFQRGEKYGIYHPADDILEAMEEMGMLKESGQRFHWLGDGEPPASKVSLRTSGSDTVVIQTHDVGASSQTVIGEVDLESVPYMVYEGAIYMHRAQTYIVERLDWENQIAFTMPVDVDYYTRASVGSDIQELTAEAEDSSNRQFLRAHGEVLVITRATGFRKIKRYTHETVGFGDIDLPEMTLDTHGYWLIFGESLTESLYEAGILLRPNDYGPNWRKQREKALERDNYTCQVCGATQMETVLHVHHKRPFRDFSYVRGENDNYLDANELHNLVTLCPSCHRRAEQGQRTRSALGGLAYLWRNLAPLFLMCDPQDIQVTAESISPLTKAPTIVIYESAAAGVGFSQRLFDLHDELLQAATARLETCACKEGCPACVGPPSEIGEDTKQMTQRLVHLLKTT